MPESRTMPHKTACFLLLAALLAPAADHDLGALAKAGKIELFNRKLDPAKAGAPEAVFLDAASNDGLAWTPGIDFSQGTIELDIKGKNQQGASFVGIAFHGQDNRMFDGVYLRPFNFQAAQPERRSHSIQYISMPDNDWSALRTKYPGKYESAITPAPDPESWVHLKVVVKGKSVSAFVNNSDTPALTVDLLSSRNKGKVGLWVGNGSDGWFRNLKVTPARCRTKVTLPTADCGYAALCTVENLRTLAFWRARSSLLTVFDVLDCWCTNLSKRV